MLRTIGTHLNIVNVFGAEQETSFWEITVSISSDVDLLSGKRKRLFDVLFIDGSYIKENHHALCVYKSIGDNLRFIHSTDLHLAKRNDEILDKIRAKASQNEFQSAQASFINFNENFRHLIRYLNSHSDEIDFVIASGDLIDYHQPDELYNPSDPNQNEDRGFERVCPFEKSNLSIFYDAVLGQGPLNRGNELTVPLFTTTGNHDFRFYHYKLTKRGEYEKFGLNEEDVQYLDDVPVLLLDPIVADVKCLKDYFKWINPDLDYLIRFGNIDVICLDGGKDNYSFFHIRDAIGGSPDTECVSDLQIELINYYFVSKGNHSPVLMVMHTPPINIKGEYNKEDLYEDSRQNSTGNRWIDCNDYDLSYGSLAHNWEKFLELLTGLTNKKGYKTDLVLSGHAHLDIQFRLEPYSSNGDNKEKVGIYCWNYCDQLAVHATPEARKNWWEANKPFVLQTAATGPLGNDEPEIRIITIENKEIKEMRAIKVRNLPDLMDNPV